MGLLDFLKSLRESFQLNGAAVDWLRLRLAGTVDLSLIKEVFVDVVVVLLNFDLDLALAITSLPCSSKPSFGSPEILKLEEEEFNRILSTLSVGFFMDTPDFILLTNLGFSMEGLGNFFTDFRALMTSEVDETKRREGGKIERDLTLTSLAH